MQVVIQKVDEAEMDDMWSVVEHKGQQRWLWHAIDQQSGAVVAYVLGAHTDAVFLTVEKTFSALSSHTLLYG